MLKWVLMIALTGAAFTSHAQYALPRAEGIVKQPSSNSLSRVVGGQAASQHEWRSFVLVRAQTAPGKTMTCGGTVISREWVLTAGHCVQGKIAADFTVTEGIDDLSTEGHKIAVDQIVLHERFADGPPRNDVALLHLTSQANSAPQALMSRDLAAVALRNGAEAILAGFGLTSQQPVLGAHTGAISTRLLQAIVPIVDRSRCTRILSEVPMLPPAYADAVSESTVCAGDVTGERDACNGDSGGPLTMKVRGRRVQAGVVSWGPGCGLRGTVGVYTSVGYFEDWIRRSAPDAVFVAGEEETSPPPAPAASSTSIAASSEPCGLPARSPVAGVRVDVAEGPRVTIGQTIHVRATPNVTGQLLVFNVDTGNCRTYQVFPNKFANGAQVNSVIAAGATVSVPGPSDTFIVRAQGPAGRNRLYAMIIPAGIPIGDLASRGVDMATLIDARSLWRELSSRAWRTRDGAPPIESVGMFNYEIVP
jgi:hypothetical protein